MGALRRQSGAARAEEVPVEPAQGANLAVQIEEWRMVMIKEQQEYEERRKEQNRKLDYLVNLAGLQV